MGDIAKAYVQVIPSADGIKGKLSSMFSGEASSAGQSTGKSMGASIVGALKGVIAAAAIGKVISASLNAGAEIQQSFGGIETLYTDMKTGSAEAADAMKKYAREASAYGVSANTYAEQAVSFGASLKQAFGGDTVKAAEAANTAIQDMADNSAKMGTDITSVQNAYQGFAKQNYTMLDNLKLGYGGTKSEMQRLLADAEKLTGIKYDINNFGDVTAAIHAVQGELGIAGVAADEAKTTFSGSFDALKASATNALAAISTGDGVPQALSSLATSISTFLFNNLIPMLGNIIMSLPSALSAFIQAAVPAISQQLGTMFSGMDLTTVVTTAVTAVQNFTNTITENLPQLISKGNEMLKSFLDGVTQNMPLILEGGKQIIMSVQTGIINSLPAIITGAADAIATFTEFILANLPQIIATGRDLLKNMMDGFRNNFPQIVDGVGQAIGKMIASIAVHLPEILLQGVLLIAQLVLGLIRAIPQIVMAVPKLVAAIVKGFADYDWQSVGKNLVKNIGEGIKSLIHMAADWGKDIIQSLINGITSKINDVKNAAGNIASAIKGFIHFSEPDVGPLSDFHTYMPDMMEGLSNGIKNGIPQVKSTMQDLAGLMSDGLMVNPSYAGAGSSVRAVTVNGLEVVINDAAGLSADDMVDAINRKLGELL